MKALSITVFASAITAYLTINLLFGNPLNKMPHPDHRSNLSKEDYAKGSIRQKDVIQRMTPRITAELTAKDLSLGSPVFIRIFKISRELEIWVKHSTTNKYHHFKTWRVAALSGTLGPKLAEGDFQAPEGFYHVPMSMMKPDSSYHLAFNIGYPNTYDKSHKRTGSFIMTHGNRVSAGCFAMTDPSIEEIYTICHAAISNGQPFFRTHIFPFRMTPERMTETRGHKWHDFWINLKEGYDYFEQSKTPPNVKVVKKRYIFE